MENLKFWTRFNERQNKHYFATAEIMDHVPEKGETVWYCGAREIVDAVLPAWIDTEQPRREVYDYNILEIQVHDADDAESAGYRYIAVKDTEEE